MIELLFHITIQMTTTTTQKYKNGSDLEEDGGDDDDDGGAAVDCQEVIGCCDCNYDNDDSDCGENVDNVDGTCSHDYVGDAADDVGDAADDGDFNGSTYNDEGGGEFNGGQTYAAPADDTQSKQRQLC